MQMLLSHAKPQYIAAGREPDKDSSKAFVYQFLLLELCSSVTLE